MIARAEQVSRSQQVLRRIQGDARFSLPALAAAMGIPYGRLKSYVSGRAPFPADCLADLFAAVAEVDQALAFWVLAECSGLRDIGLELRPTARGTDPDPIPVDVLQASHALGDLSGKLASSLRIDHLNAPDMLRDVREISLQARQLETKLEVFASVSPQRAIPGVVR